MDADPRNLGQQKQGQVEEGPDIQRKSPVEVTVGHAFEGTVDARGRAEDQAGEIRQHGFDLFVQLGQAFGARQIGPAHGQAQVFPRGFRQEGLGRLLVPNIVGDDTRAGPGELQRNGPPDAPRPAGDQEGLAFEAERLIHGTRLSPGLRKPERIPGLRHGRPERSVPSAKK